MGEREVLRKTRGSIIIKIKGAAGSFCEAKMGAQVLVEVSTKQKVLLETSTPEKVLPEVLKRKHASV